MEFVGRAGCLAPCSALPYCGIAGWRRTSVWARRSRSVATRIQSLKYARVCKLVWVSLRDWLPQMGRFRPWLGLLHSLHKTLFAPGWLRQSWRPPVAQMYRVTEPLLHPRARAARTPAGSTRARTRRTNATIQRVLWHCVVGMRIAPSKWTASEGGRMRRSHLFPRIRTGTSVSPSRMVRGGSLHRTGAPSCLRE